jgi:arabinose-5-phosphate isomerase
VPLDSDFGTALLEITRKRMGMVAIVDEAEHIQGIFTDGDLRRVLGSASAVDLGRLKIRDVMTRGPISIAPDALAVEAVRIMEERKIGQILVAADDSRLLGALHFHDLLVAKVV